jgi:hypothetical protein
VRETGQVVIDRFFAKADVLERNGTRVSNELNEPIDPEPPHALAPTLSDE